MFTGIIEEIGRIEKIQKGSHSATLTIRANKVLQDVKIGDSIAVNGVCLTVTSYGKQSFTADVMHETLNRSSFSQLTNGSCVNLERAMSINGRFGGHIVAGHVDGVGKIVRISRDENAVWYTFQAPASIMRYIVEKGSITINGISLTVAAVDVDTFSISAIPHTVRMTVLQDCKVGDLVNLENDMVGKYIERFLQADNSNVYERKSSGEGKSLNQKQSPKQAITWDFLSQCGY